MTTLIAVSYRQLIRYDIPSVVRRGNMRVSKYKFALFSLFPHNEIEVAKSIAHVYLLDISDRAVLYGLHFVKMHFAACHDRSPRLFIDSGRCPPHQIQRVKKNACLFLCQRFIERAAKKQLAEILSDVRFDRLSHNDLAKRVLFRRIPDRSGNGKLS